MKPAEIRALLSNPWKHGEAVDLAGVTVEGVLDLTGLALCGVDFRGAVFKGGLIATGARFDGLSWFHDARVEGPLDLSGALFANDARFDAAHFDATTLKGAEFRGTATFRGCHFGGAADLRDLTCYGNLDLAETRFAAGLSLKGSEFLGGLWAQGAAFPAEADFADTQVHGRLWLRAARQGNAPVDDGAFGLSFGYTYR
ncbi:pentapeptide repeat-containing protein [Pararhodobacter sp. CCB-MM2]|uniref:pentapeptide repeat-containing protein n=1 Tax=Pararhodobacter sp. CCB-MM2 TaxID=1786003 RepID=UPI0008335F9C|nr:pentapeptide repeat-containing protein [Pararhodobacter sp. CCB-MM2]